MIDRSKLILMTMVSASGMRKRMNEINICGKGVIISPK
jgi:hypothetical protein